MSALHGTWPTHEWNVGCVLTVLTGNATSFVDDQIGRQRLICSTRGVAWLLLAPRLGRLQRSLA